MDTARLALIAATQASAAMPALLEMATDGDADFIDVPVVELLAEALGIAASLRLVQTETCDTDYRAALTEIERTCSTFIQGWAG